MSCVLLDIAVKGISEIQSNDLKLVGHSNEVMDGENCSTLEKQACSENSTSICEYEEEIASDVAEPSNSHRPGCKLQVTSDALDNMNSEDTDLFTRYLGSLSSTHKVFIFPSYVAMPHETENYPLYNCYCTAGLGLTERKSLVASRSIPFFCYLYSSYANVCL